MEGQPHSHTRHDHWHPQYGLITAGIDDVVSKDHVGQHR